jgi:phage recombination protein Bet
MRENDEYLKNLTQQSGGSCTSPAAPAEPTGIDKIVAETKRLKEEREAKEAAVIVPAQVSPHIPAPAPVPKTYSQDEMLLLRNVIAKGCTEPEFKLLMYMASTYGLDPLLKQIWAVKRNDSSPALIFAGRDGMLAIAHRSGAFDGMQSGVEYEGEGKDRKPKSAWCEVWRKDMSHSFKTEVPFSEYNTGFSVWKTNPSAMILKVAESVCLRKAFSVSGLYCPEEINTGVQ